MYHIVILLCLNVVELFETEIYWLYNLHCEFGRCGNILVIHVDFTNKQLKLFKYNPFA